jgi:uncharacterized SAM-binding protein YcdF (DUF218 family)
MLWWEPQPLEIPTLPTYDVGIVFTGVTKGDKRPNDRVYFNKGADRITHTLQLFNQGKLKHILISGGLGIKNYPQTYRAERLKSFLLMAGVPDSVITLDKEAVNTYENAANSAKILHEHFAGQKYLLITSSFHMKRSKLCLEKQRVGFDTFPTDYYTGRSSLNFDDIFIPKAESIQRWQNISREVVGILTYKLMGYI